MKRRFPVHRVWQLPLSLLQGTLGREVLSKANLCSGVLSAGEREEGNSSVHFTVQCFSWEAGKK